MEHFCRRCQQVKPSNEFYQDPSYPAGHKTSCKSCICEMAKKRRTEKGTRRPQWDKQAEKVTIFVYNLFRSYDGTTPVEIPVRRVGHTHLMPSSCVIRSRNKENYLLIRGRQGDVEYIFEMVGPQHLAEILKTYGLEIVLPS